MQNRKNLSRVFLAFALLTLLCAGIFTPRVEKVGAKPVQQTPLCSSGSVITSWTFTSVTTPSTGSGAFASGSGVSASSFVTGNPGNAISLTGWDTPLIDDTAYVEFKVDTTGRSSINLKFDYFRSATGPQTLQFRYSIDGTNFIDYGTSVTTPSAVWSNLNIDISPISALDNNPNATFRIYGYGATSGAGTLRFDNVTFSCVPMVIIDSVIPVLTNAGTTVTWHGYDNGSTYELRVGGTDCSNGTIVDFGTYSGSPTPVSFNIAASSLVEGSNTIRACVALGPDTGSAVSSVIKDTVAPGITSFVRQTPSASVTNADLLTFRATFNENVTGVAISDFVIHDNSPLATSTATITNIANVSGSVYDVTVSGGDLPSFNGIVGLDFSSSAGSIVDIMGYTFVKSEPAIDEIYTIDNTATSTPTATITPTMTNTPLPAGSLSVLINEVAWAGTSSARSGDEWIELYNTESVERNLNGWRLTIDTSSDQTAETDLATFDSTDKISPGNFFVLARYSNSIGNNNIFTNVVENKEFTAEILNTGIIILRLYGPPTIQDPTGVVIDTANFGKNSGWYQGAASSTYPTMERRGKVFDNASGWQTFGGTPFALNRDGISVRGTPGRANSVLAVRSPTPTRTRTPIPTVVPVGRPIINEFLPRPGFDWNQDGKVDVFDEFIEVKNLGPVDINIGGWRLDDEEDLGSNPFTLPSVTLKPGERIVFYGLETNILLSDGGDTVRLLNPNNKVYDSYTYKIAKFEDKSACRLPDGNGSWYEDCLPTPKFTNSREGEVPSMPDGEAFESPVCDLPDTLPQAFLIAECRGYGANLWRTMYWDADGWGSDVFVPENTSKWESFVE